MSEENKPQQKVVQKRMSISQPLLQAALDILQQQPFNKVADVLLSIQQDAKPID